MPTFVIKCEIPFEYFAIVLNINACIIPVFFPHRYERLIHLLPYPVGYGKAAQRVELVLRI